MDLAFDTKVGRGAFADVWLATDPLGRSVAVKFFNDTNPSQAEKNALEHAKALARVRHPAVVQVLALEKQIHPDTGAECLCIVMEYAAGPNLSLHRDSLSLPHARTLAKDISDAIDAIHRVGLVHGDLHDGNVVITPTGAKVIDILYTHSLVEVGSKTATRTREDDLRGLAVILRQIAEKAGLSGPPLEEAYFQATTSLRGAVDVHQVFLALLADDAAPSARGSAPLDPPKSANASTGSAASRLSSTPPGAETMDLGERISSILANAHSKRTPLAGSIAEALPLAVALGDEDLRIFCERELTGYDGYVAAASLPKSIQDLRKLGSAEHRATLFYVSIGAEVNIDFFGSGQAAIEWMRDRPTEFRPIRFLFPKPVGEVERDSHATAKALLSIRMAAKDLVPEIKDPNLQLCCYAPGDAMADLLERIRVVFTNKLLIHMRRGNPPSKA